MKSLKILLALLLCAAFVLSAAACGSSAPSAPSDQETKTDNPKATAAPGGDQTDHGGDQTDHGGDQAADEAELAFNTYNGYAWLTKDGVDSCYNAAGELQFTLPKGTRAASVFYNGYAAVMKAGERGIAYVSGIVDTKGNTVLDAETLGVDGFIFGIYENQSIPVLYDLYNREKRDDTFNDFNDLRPVEDSLLEDGWIFAYKQSESYEGAVFEVGVVDMQGNWVAPLAKDNIATLKGWYSPGTLLQNLTYCKEGVWMWAKPSLGGDLDEDTHYFNLFFYSLEQNTWAQLIGNNINSYGDTYGLTFENGTAIVVGSATSGMSYITPPKAGDVNINPVNKELNYEYFYSYDREGHVIFVSGEGENGHDNVVGYDENLKELFRTNYYRAWPFLRSSHGYQPVTIRNENGTDYWSLIDRNGEFLFEPKEGTIGNPQEFYMDDDFMIFWHKDMFGDIAVTVYDLEGNELQRIDYDLYKHIEYHNGVLRASQEHGRSAKYVKLPKHN